MILRASGAAVSGDPEGRDSTSAAIFSARLGRPVTYSAEHEDRAGGGEARKMASWFDRDGFRSDISALRAVYPALKDFTTYVAEAEWLAE